MRALRGIAVAAGVALLATVACSRAGTAVLDARHPGERQPKADARIAYGPDPLQFADLWLPAGRGPHPLVLMVHGGCWQSDVGKADLMNAIADDLRRRGIAVWNIEYRGIDRPGGGYPGTFQDVAAAADALRAAAPKYRLRIDRVVAVGHSAGGHLAMWLAARPRIAPASRLWSADPLPISAVVSQGGLPDLAAARDPAAVCGAETIDRLVGPPTISSRQVYSDTSPAELAPFGVAQTLVNGGDDGVAPPSYADAWVAKVNAKGDHARRIVVPGQGHLELIAPGTPAWAAQLPVIRAALGLKPEQEE